MTDIENEESVSVRLHNLADAVAFLSFKVGELTAKVEILEREIKQLKGVNK